MVYIPPKKLSDLKPATREQHEEFRRAFTEGEKLKKLLDERDKDTVVPLTNREARLLATSSKKLGDQDTLF